jgi:hypothetical protein
MSSSGLRGRRMTYLTILKRAWSANFIACPMAKVMLGTARAQGDVRNGQGDIRNGQGDIRNSQG